jgi:hypothetical protein
LIDPWEFQGFFFFVETGKKKASPKKAKPMVDGEGGWVYFSPFFTVIRRTTHGLTAMNTVAKISTITPNKAVLNTAGYPRSN